jgi:hypothetical protein
MKSEMRNIRNSGHKRNTAHRPSPHPTSLRIVVIGMRRSHPCRAAEGAILRVIVDGSLGTDFLDFLTDVNESIVVESYLEARVIESNPDPHALVVV